FIVSAYQKGIRGFDVDLAYEGLVKNHSENGIMAKAGYEHQSWSGGGMKYYLNEGYIPFPLDRPAKGFHEDGSGQTLENAYQDWTLSELASALGKDDDAKRYAARAQNYKNLWKDDLDWMWIRNLDGSWREPIDLLDYAEGWVEGNAAQFTWWVPQDVEGLIKLMGSRQHFTDKLNTVFEGGVAHDFTAAKSHQAGEQRENRRVYINYGNQPCMHMAYLFNYAGSPWLTQFWTRQVIEAVYSGVSPEYGYSGDEDQGLMGSLAVLMKIGLFSTRGGAAVAPVYEIGSPIFEKTTITLDPDYYPGGQFSIIASNASKENLYIDAAKLDGTTINRPWFHHRDLIDGGKLELSMSDTPNKEWGSAYDAAPPSQTNDL
nr:glycoside hydrolase family 92 protein [Saprospiraceae bacterium]